MIIFKEWNKVHRLRTFLDTAPDGKYTIKPYKESRGNHQNNLYWWLLSYAESITGTKAENYHEWFKLTHLPKAKRKRIECFWKVKYKKTELTTTTMKKDEFARYFTDCSRDFEWIWILLPPYNSPELESLLSSYF